MQPQKRVFLIQYVSLFLNITSHFLLFSMCHYSWILQAIFHVHQYSSILPEQLGGGAWPSLRSLASLSGQPPAGSVGAATPRQLPCQALTGLWQPLPVQYKSDSSASANWCCTRKFTILSNMCYCWILWLIRTIRKIWNVFHKFISRNIHIDFTTQSENIAKCFTKYYQKRIPLKHPKIFTQHIS